MARKPAENPDEPDDGIEYETDPAKRRQTTGVAKRTVKAVRRAGVLRQAREGKSSGAIAKALGISQRTVFRDLNFVKAWALRDARATFSETIDDLRAENDILKREMIAAYERSKQGRRVVKTGVPTKGGEEGGLEITTYESPGDPAYIDRILKINDQILKMLEIEADPHNRADLRDAPPVWYLEVADREDVEALKDAVEFEDLAEKIRDGRIGLASKAEEN